MKLKKIQNKTEINNEINKNNMKENEILEVFLKNKFC